MEEQSGRGVVQHVRVINAEHHAPASRLFAIHFPACCSTAKLRALRASGAERDLREELKEILFGVAFRLWSAWEPSALAG